MNVKLNKNSLKIFTAIFGTIIVVGFFIIMNSNDKCANDSEGNTESIAQFQTVNASDFQKEIVEQDAVILDIRTKDEYDLGRISNSINIDYYSPRFRNELEKLDKDAEYKIYCNSGNRSKTALDIMKELGFTNVTELKGGIQAWINSGGETCVNC
ncbi:MAG: rhodanese-like domain-containing protein [Candidatus Dojkabacteria bacterium]|nr:rhodanese-like domain-containing protein [Candidatus Dojkabacteria bacterium]